MPDTRRAEDFRSAANACWFFQNSHSLHSKVGGSTWLQSRAEDAIILNSCARDRSLRATLHSRRTDRAREPQGLHAQNKTRER